MNDPTIPGAVLTADEADPHWLEEHRSRAAEQESRIPLHFADAVASEPIVANWVRVLVQTVRESHRTVPRVLTGRSLLISGPIGTGKTYQAYGAIRALGESGAGFSWLAATAADLYGALRPRSGVDSEREFLRFADVGVLVLDDLGAAKGTEWNEEINFRLLNHRYERKLPTIVTTNVPARKLRDELGERLASRLIEMADRVYLTGGDRRLSGPRGVA
jgi:DNA replication protein DnaC